MSRAVQALSWTQERKVRTILREMADVRSASQQAIGARIRELRLQRRLSQEALARLLNMSSQTLSRWERGKVAPYPENLDALAEILEVDVAEIVGPPTAATPHLSDRLTAMEAQLGWIVDVLRDELLPFIAAREPGPPEQPAQPSARRPAAKRTRRAA